MTLNKGSKFNVYKGMGQMVYNCKRVRVHGYERVRVKVTLGNCQSNCWTTLDWTSQIPLKVVFSSENNQDVINSQLFIKY